MEKSIIKNIELFARQNGINSKCYVIKYDDGSRYVWKQDKHGYSVKQLKSIKDIISYCYKEGSKVPEYIDVNYMKFCDGKPFNCSQKSFSSLAKELAILHMALSSYPSKYIYAPNKQFYKHLIPDELDDFKSILTKKDYAFLKDIFASHTDRPGSLHKKQICHYDLQPGNVLFQGDKVNAILDFDAMRMDWRMRDIAFASFRFAYMMAHGNIRQLEDDIKSFLNIYSSWNTLYEYETEHYMWFLYDRFLDPISYVLRKSKLGQREWAASLPKFINFLKIAINMSL